MSAPNNTGVVQIPEWMMGGRDAGSIFCIDMGDDAFARIHARFTRGCDAFFAIPADAEAIPENACVAVPTGNKAFVFRLWRSGRIVNLWDGEPTEGETVSGYCMCIRHAFEVGPNYEFRDAEALVFETMDEYLRPNSPLMLDKKVKRGVDRSDGSTWLRKRVYIAVSPRYVSSRDQWGTHLAYGFRIEDPPTPRRAGK